MATHVEVRVEAEVGASHDEHALGRDGREHEGAGCLHLLTATHGEPGPLEESSSLQLEDPRVRVGRLWQGLGLRQGREHRAELGGRKRQAWHDFTRSIVPDPDGVKAGSTVMIP